MRISFKLPGNMNSLDMCSGGECFDMEGIGSFIAPIMDAVQNLQETFRKEVVGTFIVRFRQLF